MKKLSIVIVLMAAGFTFADAQTTEAKEAAKPADDGATAGTKNLGALLKAKLDSKK